MKFDLDIKGLLEEHQIKIEDVKYVKTSYGKLSLNDSQLFGIDEPYNSLSIDNYINRINLCYDDLVSGDKYYRYNRISDFLENDKITGEGWWIEYKRFCCDLHKWHLFVHPDFEKQT